MKTTTVTKQQFATLKLKASLYDELLKSAEKPFGIESYSPKRIKEFLKEDRLTVITRKRFQQFLSNLNVK